MWRAVRLLLFCAALGGCSATSGGIASLTSIGGSGSSDMPSKAAATPSSSQSSSSGGIWTNFSSAFSSGDQPAQASQKGGDDMAPGLDPNEALGLVNEYRSSKGPACPFFGKPRHGGGGNSRQRHGQPRSDVSPWPERSGSSEASDHVGIPLQGRGGKCQRRPEVLCPNRRGVETKPASQPKLAARRCEAYGHRLRV